MEKIVQIYPMGKTGISFQMRRLKLICWIFLIKLAFRFYKKLYDGEVDSNFFEESKNINNDVVEFYKSEKGLEGHFPRKDNKAELVCLNCNKHFHTTEIPKNNNFLPLCSECEKTIGQEIEIWQKLFD